MYTFITTQPSYTAGVTVPKARAMKMKNQSPATRGRMGNARSANDGAARYRLGLDNAKLA